MAMPPRRPRKWSKTGVSPQFPAQYALIIDRLRELQPEMIEGDLKPVALRLDPDAEALWSEYFTRHNAEQVLVHGALASAYSKLEGGAARLALVIHLMRWAAGESVSATHIDGISMKAGIVLAEWFKAETKRVYAVLHESDDQKRRRELIQWIERRGGTTTFRDVTRGPRVYRDDHALAKADLDAIAADGRGHWEHPPPGTKGGAPSTRFTVGASGDGDNTPHLNGASGGSVTVAGVTTQKQWGVIE